MKVAYLSLQAVVEGQDSWAAVNEVIGEWETAGWSVDRWFAAYAPGKIPGGFTRLREMRRLQLELRERLDEYDVLYIRGHMMAYPVARAAHKRRIPVVHECHGTYEDLFVAWPITRLARPLFEYLQRAQYKEADLIFCGTEQQRIWLQGETGRTDLVISPNGASDVVFTPNAPKRTGLPDEFAVFFGQFAPWQGIRFLIEARKNPVWPQGVPLVFVGDGADRSLVEAAVEYDAEMFRYLGRLPYTELAGVVAHSIASFSPQYTLERGEAGFSALKLYETMACGVPIIGSDYPGVGDVIRHYDCGKVVAPGDADALADAVASLYAHPDEAHAMGSRGRAAVVSECSWRARARQRRKSVEALSSVQARLVSRKAEQ